jgi:cardiolipin synthase
LLAPRDIPNLISIGRVILVGPVVWALLEGRFGLAMVLFLVAGASDGLDGYLAKRFDWRSRLGGILDPLADKFLLVSTFICLGWLGHLPVWLVGLVLLRDLVIVVGALVYHFRVARFQAEPTLISKLNTLMQIILALLVVFSLGVAELPAGLITGLVWTVTATTALSGLGYVVEWTRRALAGSRERATERAAGRSISNQDPPP